MLSCSVAQAWVCWRAVSWARVSAPASVEAVSSCRASASRSVSVGFLVAEAEDLLRLCVGFLEELAVVGVPLALELGGETGGFLLLVSELFLEG